MSEAASDKHTLSGSTAVDKEDVRSIKKNCKNGLHFCCPVLLDPDLKRLVSGCLNILKPFRELHTQQSKMLRSAEEALEWYKRRSLGQGVNVLAAAADKSRDAVLLQEAGLWRGGNLPHGLRREDLSTQHPTVAGEDQVARYLGNLIANLIKHCSRSMMFHTHGWPGRLCAILDAEEGQRVLDVLRSDYETWLRVSTLTYALWVQFKKRYPFNMIAMKRVVKFAED